MVHHLVKAINDKNCQRNQSFSRHIGHYCFDACGAFPSPTPSATLTPVVGPPSGIPALSPTATVTTAGQLAITGQSVYAKSCASCHGDQGKDGKSAALIGTAANLGKYKTAAGLNQFISLSMPMNSPGRLSAQDYLSATSYLLVQNNLVKAEVSISAGQLNAIKLQ
jgi:mono/diheme cytochrome c family protein